ncbi:bifunctional aminoglycoside phosphotransferase/ATP-binding protein [Kamptonema formosum]|uniref:bifunctional aminoglycoside phosphotransferase/ATP-binding protein n=1 Tax=Kamptonema formosum TaxID=331992 RepID=UPI0003468D70|nr:AAA family ATPase [Oscillatoria sp. PCC 10802]
MGETCLPRLIEGMLQPEFYPHPVRVPVELIQTHISFVLLTGDYVYKVKKPVNFGFLDYSTLEKRQYFCQRELQMNQRGAPGLYLAVVPVTQAGTGFRLGGEGEPVEYAVKMRQFPQDGLFVSMLERGALAEKHLEELGRVVAKFHAQAPVSEWILSFGEVSQIRKSVEQNYELSKKYIGGPLTQELFEATKRYTDNFFAEGRALFFSRIESQRIRECHGDLHLRNIALWEDKILLFDCIEFNEDFRFVDVMYDVAFTVMDLQGRGRGDLANAFLNTYIEGTGDWEGLQVLPLYLIRQSYVRANVTSLLLDDPGVSAQEKEKAQQTAAHYYRLAWQYTQPRTGQLILMSGLSGSGKSTVARKLARRQGAIHIRSDAVRKHLAGIPLHQRGGEEIYTAEMTEKTYHRLLQLGVMLAAGGWPVILDAKYDRQALRRDAIALAEVNQLPLQILHCTAPVEVLRARLHRRTGDIADATADLLAAQLAGAEPFTEAERVYVRTLDTAQDIEAQLCQ